MRYADFEKLIHGMAASASQTARRSFALDTLNRLHACCQKAIREEFTEAERARLHEILAGLEQQPAPELKQKLLELNDILCRDPVRSIEFNPKTTQLLCAIDNWIDYLTTRDPQCVSNIAINMVNAVDCEIDRPIAEYSIDNMLGAPEMIAEHQRQQRMLAGHEC
jgi:hypothetical protein